MTYLLCLTISGRAAYLHVGAMLGTWMTANVFMRIIPRQIKMVEASKKGEPVNQEWGKNAKNRSTHNTYFTLPVIFIMLSNHFPNTYGHDYNWLILLLICAGGAAIREYFVVRLNRPKRSMTFGVIGVALITGVIIFSQAKTNSIETPQDIHSHVKIEEAPPKLETSPEIAPSVPSVPVKTFVVRGVVSFEGEVPKGKKLNLPSGCKKSGSGDVFSNEVIVTSGKVQNVLVRVMKGQEGLVSSPVPSEEVILDQKGCMYSPRVVGAFESKI
jgi:hypothetical protein